MGDDAGPEFADWVLARRGSLLRIAWLLTGEGAGAEDLVQTALLRCWPRWSRVRRMADIDAYVHKIMSNAYVSGRRRHWRCEVPTAVVPEPPTVKPIDDDGAELLAALGRLPRGQRAVVVLRFAEDLSERQTAALLGCSVGTVKSQTARALAALRADASLSTEDRA